MKVRKRSPGRPPVLEEAVRVDVVLEKAQVDAMHILGSDHGLSRNELVRMAVDEFLNKEPERE